MNRITIVFKLSVFLLFLFIADISRANIYYIDFNKVNYPQSLQPEVSFLQNNIGIYDHWNPQWTASIKQDVVIKHLTDLYKGIKAIANKNAEAYLLLGDVGHYLYNVNVDPYYQKAVDNYEQAIKLNPDDYRGYWFLGSHYSASAKPVEAIANFETGITKLPANAEWGFWADYAFACVFANMPSTASYALKQAEVLGGGNDNTKFLATQVKNMLQKVNKDTTIKAADCWAIAGKAGNQNIIVNRVAGLKLLADSAWGGKPYDYQNKTTAIVFSPGKLIGKTTKQSIGYSIVVIVKIAEPGQSLDDFLKIFTKSIVNPKPTNITDRFKESIALESSDPATYPNIGGAHSYMMAVGSNEPPYPGVALEKADKLPMGKGLNYYKVTSRYSRLGGKLYYYVLLDTCEDIREESFAVFKSFIDNLVIE